MINQNEAIEKARQHIAGWEHVDSEAVNNLVFSSRARALEQGVKDGPCVRDAWLVGFKRIPYGHALEDVHPRIVVIVDAETGKTSILESL